MHASTAYCSAVSRSTHLVAMTLVFVAFSVAGGCVPAPAGSPLQGFWVLEVPDSAVALRFLVEFDANGGAMTVIYQVDDGPTRLRLAPSGQTSVSGTTLSIDLTFGGDEFNAFEFSGEPAADGESIVGTASVRVRESGRTAHLRDVAAVLSRVSDAARTDAVLTGTWEHLPGQGVDPGELRQFLVEFDENDSPIQVIYKIGEDVTVIDDAPSGLFTAADDAVTLVLQFTGGTLLFEGAIEAEDELSGEVTISITNEDTTVDIEAQPATLLRVVAPEEEQPE